MTTKHQRRPRSLNSEEGMPDLTPDPETDRSIDSENQNADSVEAFEQISVPSCIEFSKFGEDNSSLVATVEPNEDMAGGISAEIVRWWIRCQGCEGWYLHEEKIALLLREIHSLEKAKEYFLAERRDCQVEVQVSTDRLKAWVRVSPAFGGEPPTENLLRQALENAGVRFGINRARLQQIVSGGSCDKELIAEGVPPVRGEKARFEQLVHESSHKGIPQERENGTVDYKDLGLFLSVAIGTPLLRRHPPTTGTPGTGVDGVLIQPVPGPDRPLHAGIGTAISKEDPGLAVAARPGRPSYDDFSVRVDDTLELDGVNPSTGDVNFDGNVLIRGPIDSGFKVKAGQDITVLDTVEGSDLIAGRNINVLTGVYGRSRSNLRAKGNIQARFLSECNVSCGGNVEIIDLVAYSTVICEGILHLGILGGKGQAYGGRLVALQEVRARTLGSVSETKTLVEVMIPPTLLQRQKEVTYQAESSRKKLEDVRRSLQSLKSSSIGNRDAKLKELTEEADSLSLQLDELKKQKEEILKKIEASRKGRIRAEQVTRGVTLHVGSVWQVVENEIMDLFLQEPPSGEA